MGGLFEDLCILESVDQLELFTLHSRHVCLILRLFFSLTGQFLFELLPSAILPLHELLLTLRCGNLLLLLDHVLHFLGTLRLCGLLLLVHLPRRLLLHLGVQCGLLLALLGSQLAILHSLIRLLLVLTICLAFHSLFHLLLAKAVLLGLLILDVSLSLADDLIRALSRLIDLLHHLLSIITKTFKH